eukprot:scaffold53313_cov53-Phaeocystis_antarctica.AAC.2
MPLVLVPVCLSLIRRVWLFLYAAGNKQPANGFTLPVLYFTSCENPARIQVRLFQTRVQATLADRIRGKGGVADTNQPTRRSGGGPSGGDVQRFSGAANQRANEQRRSEADEEAWKRVDARAKEHLARFIAQRDILAARAVAEDRSGHSDVVRGESQTHINRRPGGEASGEDVEFPCRPIFRVHPRTVTRCGAVK